MVKAAELPEFTQQTIAQPQASPDWGNEMRNFGAATNALSSMGAAVAQAASTKLATDLGTRAGETPSGDLLPPLTDFDKVYQQSYMTQANATLSLQGSKLLSEAQIQMAKASRLSPDLIAQNQRNVGSSLQNLVDMAPSLVQPKLKEQFGAMLISNNQALQSKMISQQREDQRDNILAALNENTKNVYNLRMSGEDQAAEELTKSTKEMLATGVSANLISRLQAAQGAESVLKSSQAGKYTGMALAARREGKLEEFYKDFSTNKPDDLTYAQWQHVGASISSYMGGLQNLEKQDETLRLTNFALDLARDPTGITPEQLVELQENVSPLGFAKAQLAMVKAQQKATGDQVSAAVVAANFGNVEAFSGLTAKQKNGGFDALTKRYQQQQEAKGTPVTAEEAQMNVAMTAGGTVPKYVDQLNGQLGTANPILLNPAIASIDAINAAGKGQNIQGLSDNAIGMMETYKSLRQTYPEAEAAQKAHEVIYSKSAEQRTANNEAWASYVKDQKDKGETNSSFALRMADVPRGTSINPNLMGDKIYNQFQSYFKVTNGDTETALKMTKQYVNDNYGISKVNGKSEYQYMPIEKALDLPENATGAIHADLAEQVAKQFAPTKELYDKKLTDWYWEVKPTITIDDARLASQRYHEIHDNLGKAFVAQISSRSADIGGLRHDRNSALARVNEFNNSAPPKVIQHFRDGHTQEFSLVVQANDSTRKGADGSNIGNWDVSLRSKNGFMSIASADPSVSSMIYRPNKTKITMDYLSVNRLPATSSQHQSTTSLAFPTTDKTNSDLLLGI